MDIIINCQAALQESYFLRFLAPTHALSLESEKYILSLKSQRQKISLKGLRLLLILQYSNKIFVKTFSIITFFRLKIVVVFFQKGKTKIERKLHDTLTRFISHFHEPEKKKFHEARFAFLIQRLKETVP